MRAGKASCRAHSRFHASRLRHARAPGLGKELPCFRGAEHQALGEADSMRWINVVASPPKRLVRKRETCIFLRVHAFTDNPGRPSRRRAPSARAGSLQDRAIEADRPETRSAPQLKVVLT